MLPQIIYLGLILMSLGFIFAKHGKPRSDYNGWNSLIETIIVLLLLWWSDFFDCFIM